MTTTPSAPAAPATAAATDLARPDGTPVRVLVVDDEAPLADLLSMALRYEGWQRAHRGATAPSALRAAREYRPGRGRARRDAARHGRPRGAGRLRRETPDVPVLFLTAQGRGRGPYRRA